MKRPATSLSALLIGLGIGAVGGAVLGAGAVWPGLVVGVVGVGLSLAGSKPADVGGEAAVQPPSEHPTLAGLGSRVEQIIRLAEEQADDHRTRAEREAELMLSEARLILDRARAEAAGLMAASKPETERSSSGD
jgi:hypothetical protein